MTPTMEERLAAVLRGSDAQAVLHELLAARLTDAPEADVERIRVVFDLTLDEESPELAAVGVELFGFYDEQICELVGRLEGSKSPLLAQIRAEAFAARMIAILGAIEQHAAALSAAPGRQAVAAFQERYRRHVTDHHGLVEPPDFERRRRVPIGELYVQPMIVRLVDNALSPDSGAAGTVSPRQVDLWTLARDIDRTVLLGDPGGGKTTAANALMHYQASDSARKVPFLVTLREFAAVNPPERSVAGHIEHRLANFYQCPAPHGIVARLLQSGSAIVIFDGLDELLDPVGRLEVAAIIERFCAEYPLASILVTSRATDYDQAQLDDRQFARYRIGRFGDEQVEEYVNKWFTLEEGHDEAEAKRSATAFMSESVSVVDLRHNPLMLALMCILYRGQGSLPRDRAGIYEQCSSLLFRKWDARRKIYTGLRANYLIEPALQHIAWWLFNRDQVQPSVTERELVKEVAGFLNARGFESAEEAREAAEEFVGFCRGRMWVFAGSGANVRGEILYSFTHRTFLEYFAAAHLALESDTPERLARTLAPHVARNEWEVVGELAIQIKDHTSSRGAERIYTAMLGERQRRSPTGRAGVLQFLARCLRSVNPPPRTTRALTREVLGHLFAGNPDDSVRHMPLCVLLACCDQQRQIVSDEIGSRVTRMASTADPDIQRKGLSLAIFLPFGEHQTSYGPGLPGGSQLANFWWDRTAEHLRANADTVVTLARDDFDIRLGAIWWNIITIGSALEMPGGLAPLFNPSFGIFGDNWTAFLPQIAGTAMSMGNHIPAAHTAALTDFGYYLTAQPAPPWIHNLTEDLGHYVQFERSEQSRTESAVEPFTDPFAYLGAAVTLCIIIESVEPKPLPGEDRDWIDSILGRLYPYIMQRTSNNSILPREELPIPEPFKNILSDWADRKINFVSRSQSAKKRGASVKKSHRSAESG